MSETARVLPLVRDGPHRAAMLGSFRLIGPRGADITPRGRKTRALLAYLLMAPGATSRERLAALFWGDRGEEQAKASVRQALYELRDLAAGPEALLRVRRDEAEARPDGVERDLDRLLAAAERGDAGVLAAELDGAELTLLADLDGAGADFDDWLTTERTRWRDRLAAAAVEAGEAALAAGRTAEARRLADALERADPLNEPVARLGLRGDRAAGDLAALHRRYRRFSEALRRDLDVDPAPETQALLRVAARASPEPVTDAAVEPVRRARPWLWPAVAAAVLVVAGAGAWGWSRYAAPPGTPSVAVLPFAGPPSQAQDRYFAGGVSDAVSEDLRQAAGLEVMGGPTARLLGAGADPLVLARRAGAAYLLRGEARRDGGRMLVSARLVRVRDGRTVWSDSYRRPAEDVFAVQHEVAAAVADRLGGRIAARPSIHLTTRPEVYDRYLQAQALMRERRAAALQEARRLLLEAAALDPDYAPTFSSLSQVTMLLTDHPTAYGDVPIVRAQTEARQYARRALALAPELADAYAAYGLISLSDAQSLPFYARAVVLDPQRPDFHRWLAQAYSAVGREDEALKSHRRAVALDPLGWLSVDHLVGQLAFMGRPEEAAAVADRFVRISTDPHGVGRVQAKLALEQGRLADYLRLSEAGARRWPAERNLAGELAGAWSLLGENARAARSLPEGSVGRLSLSGDLEGLAREARRMGPAFWQEEPGYWSFAESLVLGGHGDLLLQLYDAEFASVQEFTTRTPSKAMAAGPSLITAMTQAGRQREAQALADLLLLRLDADVRGGMDPGHAAYDRATLLAVTGHPDAALEQLAFAVRRNWVNLTWIPARRLEDRLTLRSLRGDPRLARVQTELDAQINRQRALLGLPPLRT